MVLERIPLYASLGFGYLAIALLRWYRRISQLPPGPRKLPLFGNLFNLPTKLDTRILAEMGKEYRSEILHFEALGNSLVVLNSRRVAEELLEKRSTIYSGRPQLPMIDLTGWSFQFTIWPYGDRWRTARRIFTKFFNQPDAYQRRVTRYVNKLLRDLLDDPDNYYSHIRHVPGSVTIDTTYGIRVSSPSNPFVKLAEESAADATDILSSTYLVDVFPFLRHLPLWFPGAGKLNLRRAKKSRELAWQIRRKPYEATVEMMKTGIYERSLVSTTLELKVEADIDEDLLKSAAGAVYMAGSDTTTAGLGSLILALTMYPEAQKKAQRELDNALHGSLPTVDTIKSALDLGAACPGRQIAQSILTLTAASVLSLFDISKKVGENGELVEPRPEYHASAIEGPTEFPCTIKPRSHVAIELIQDLDDD